MLPPHRAVTFNAPVEVAACRPLNELPPQRVITKSPHQRNGRAMNRYLTQNFPRTQAKFRGHSLLHNLIVELYQQPLIIILLDIIVLMAEPAT